MAEKIEVDVLFAFSTKVFDNGKSVVGGVIPVPPGTESRGWSTPQCDIYIDVFGRKADAEKARSRAIKEA